MPEEPLDRQILREIRERLEQSRAAMEEYRRLTAALEALEPAADRPPARGRGRQPSTGAGRPRAARGANRDRAMEVIADRPGITVAELASVTGISRNVLYGLMRTLTARGVVERVELPGDGTGFRATGDGDGGTTNGAPAAEAERAEEPADATAPATPPADAPAADTTSADEPATETALAEASADAGTETGAGEAEPGESAPTTEKPSARRRTRRKPAAGAESEDGSGSADDDGGAPAA